MVKEYNFPTDATPKKGKIEEIIEGEIGEFSVGIKNIVALTQQQYDNLPIKDPAILYIIPAV